MPSTPKDDSKVSKPAADIKVRKIVDVAAPGKTPPSPSSKPIIVSNRPILKRDPMMTAPGGLPENSDITPVSRVARTIKVGMVEPLTDEQKAADAPAAVEAPKKADASTKLTAPTIADLMSKKIAIQAKDDEPPTDEEKKIAQDVGVEAVTAVVSAPPEQPEPVAKPEPKKEDKSVLKEATAADMPPKPKPAPAPAPIPAPPIPATPTTNDSVPAADADEEGDGDGQLAPNQIVDQAKRKEASDQASKLADQEKIIDSQQFFLPISDQEKRKGMEFTLLVLVIVLALTVVWFDLMLDAGILKVGGLQSFTHFFRQ